MKQLTRKQLKMASKENNVEINCDFCNKSFGKSVLLKHIGQSKSCKSYYGPRFTEMKKENAKKRVYKHRNNMTMKERKKKWKRNRELYAKNEAKKERNKQKHKQTYKEKKEIIKAENEKKSEDFFIYMKEENEKEIDALSDKGENLNILYKSTENLEEILEEPEVICQHCKDIFNPSSIFKHIGNNKGCKAFYGQDFEDLKKKKNKIRSKKYSLAKEREKYATDTNFKEKKKKSSKKSYETLKEKQNAIKEKQKVENKKKDAKFSYEFKKKVAKDLIYLWRKKLEWFPKCFTHFLETFPDTDGEVKRELTDIGKSINEMHENMERKVDEILEKVKDSEDSTEIYNAFKGEKIGNYEYKGGIEEEDIKHKYQLFEHYDVRRRLEKVLESVDESEKNKDWYFRIQIIQGTAIERFPAWWEDEELKYIKKRNCIICKKEPNCLEKNWLTKVEFEKVKFGPNVYLARGLKEPTDA